MVSPISPRKRRPRAEADRGRKAPVVLFKLSAGEKAAIGVLAERYDMTVSEWCRYRALRDGPASKAEIKRLIDDHEL